MRPLFRSTLLAVLALGLMATPAVAGGTDITGVWTFGARNLRVDQTTPNHYDAIVLGAFTSPDGSCKLVNGQRYWNADGDGTTGQKLTGTENIENQSDDGSCHGNTQAKAIFEVLPANPKVLRICHNDPFTGDDGDPVFDDTDPPFGAASGCDEETRLGDAADIARHLTVNSYIKKIKGGKCVKAGPRLIDVYFRNDETQEDALAIADPALTTTVFLNGHHLKGLDETLPGLDATDPTAVETTKKTALTVKVVVKTARGKTYSKTYHHAGGCH